MAGSSRALSNYRPRAPHAQTAAPAIFARESTLAKEKNVLNRVGLRWRRFAPTFSSAVPQLFQQRFGVDAFSKQATLKKWHDFEKENPHTFAAMYQFFVQKSCANGACGTNQEEL